MRKAAVRHKQEGKHFLSLYADHCRGAVGYHFGLFAGLFLSTGGVACVGGRTTADGMTKPGNCE